MTTPNPFAINNNPISQYGNLFLSLEQKENKNGPYYQFEVTICPISGGDLITRKYFNFAQTPSETKIFLDGLNAATNNQPMTLVNPNGTWVEYEWVTYRDYTKKTQKHYQDNNPDKLQADEKGRLFVEKGAIKLLRVFLDENEAIAAHDSAKGIENSNNPFATNGNGTAAPAPAAAPVADKETASKFLPWIVKTAMAGGNKVDRDVLATMIAGNDALRQHFTVDSPEVAAEIAKLETEPAF